MVAACLMGACFGFLWWNASPAKIFMGDTGSLALGGALAGLAITTRTELLLVLLGGLFVLITLSVIIQVGSFKLTGRRVFRMAPLQHHFELAGLGRGHHRDPVLDHRRAVRRARARGVLRRVGGGVMSGRADGSDAHRRAADWAGLRVVVAGIGVSGFAAADALLDAAPRSWWWTSGTARTQRDAGRGARPSWARPVPARPGRLRRELPAVGGAGRPTWSSPRRAGGRTSRCWPRPRPPAIPVWGEVELAWRLRPPTGAAPWLTLTGTNGKTTTVRHAHLDAARPPGAAAVAAGNVGTPLLEAVLHPQPVRRARGRAVQLPAALVVLAAPAGQRLPQHRARPRRLARLAGAYAADKGRVYTDTEVACVYNAAGPGDRAAGRATPT